MSDLTPIGDVLVSVQAEHLSADELRDRHDAIRDQLARHGNVQLALIQMGWLCLVAIERIRQIEEESNGERPDRHRTRTDRDRSDPPVARRPGGGWTVYTND